MGVPSNGESVPFPQLSERLRFVNRCQKAAAIVLVIVFVWAAAGNAETLGRCRVMLLGDSWAMFMTVFRSFDQALEARGLADTRILPLNYPGTKASEWNGWLGRFVIAFYLARNPSVDVVVMTLGGNDLLDGYSTRLTDAEKDKLFDGIRHSLEGLVSFILSRRSDLRVVICGYDYPNYVESVEYNLFDVYRRQWEDAGRPTPNQANDAVVRLGRIQQAIADKHRRVEFVNNFGLMQWTFGYPNRGIAPESGPYPADRLEEAAPPGGYPDLPSPPGAMLQVWFFLDAIHLSPEGYALVAGNVVDRCLADLLTGTTGANGKTPARASRQMRFNRYGLGR